LEAWLAQMHSLLTSRDGHTIPHDVKAIESQISEHNVNHYVLKFDSVFFSSSDNIRFYIVGFCVFCPSFISLILHGLQF